MTIDKTDPTQLQPIPGIGAYNAMWMPLIYPERARLFRGTLITWPSPQTLYHYTNVSAFYSIISNRGLWASHIAYMNDASEIHHGRQFAREIIGRLARKNRYQFFRDILMQTMDLLESNVLPDLYICCFSRGRDDLSQWRAYANTAGVCIGVPYPEAKFYVGTLTQMYNVIYDDYTKARLINFVITKYAREYKNDLKHYSTSPSNPLDHQYIEYIILGIEKICVGFKNIAFSGGREIRLVFHPYRDELRDKFVKFRSSTNFIIPYCDTSDLHAADDPNARLPITEVLVAPSPHANLVQRGIEEFLKAKGYPPLPVTQSAIPFRTL